MQYGEGRQSSLGDGNVLTWSLNTGVLDVCESETGHHHSWHSTLSLGLRLVEMEEWTRSKTEIDSLPLVALTCDAPVMYEFELLQ